MPKQKTHKGAASRIRVTGSGKLVRRHGEQSHMRRKKRKALRRAYHTTEPVAPADVKRVTRLMPYAGK